MPAKRGVFNPNERSSTASGSAASCSAPDEIRFEVRQGAMVKKFKVEEPATVADVIAYIIADPKPFTGVMTADRMHTLTMNNEELNNDHVFDPNIRLHIVKLMLTGGRTKSAASGSGGASGSKSSSGAVKMVNHKAKESDPIAFYLDGKKVIIEYTDYKYAKKGSSTWVKATT
jgi:hypothetical protein